jgi:hypothetical protein
MARRPLLAFAVLTVLAVLTAGTAACSSGGKHSPTAAASSSGTSVQQMLGIGRRFAQCARDHGYPALPDPEIQDGRLAFPANQYTKEQLEEAEKVPECKAILAELPPAHPKDNNPTLNAADMQKAREYAKCMREQGIPDWPDPVADGSFPLNAALQAEGKSQRILTASEACKQYWVS